MYCLFYQREKEREREKAYSHLQRSAGITKYAFCFSNISHKVKKKKMGGRKDIKKKKNQAGIEWPKLS